MTALRQILTAHRWLAWLLVVLLSVPPTLGLSGITLLASRDARWSTEDDYAALNTIQNTFTSQLASVPVLLVIESDGFFQPGRLRALWKTVAEFEQIEDVRRVLWMGTVPRVTLFGQQPLLPDIDTDAADLIAAEQQITSHPLIAGQLLSEDGRTLLLGLFTRQENTWQACLQIARRTLEPHGMTVRITGPVPLIRAHRRAFEADHYRILYTAMALIIGLALVIFRGLPAIIITCTGPIVGVAWTLGWLAFLGEELNELTEIILPVMAMIIGFTDSVHIVVHVRQERVAGKSQREAAATAIDQVGLACLLTSITTAIGFASLMIADAEIIQSFGRSSAIGVLVTFVAVVLVIPLLTGSRIGRNIHKGHERDLVGTNMQRLTGFIDWTVQHARLVSCLGILATAALAVGASTLQPDDRLAHRVPHNCEEWRAMQHCDQSFGGIRFLRVLVSWDEQVARSDVWKVLRETETRIDAEPLLGRALSIRHWLSIVPGTEGPHKLAMAPLLPEEFRHEFWNPDEQKAHIVSLIQDLGMVTYQPIIHRLTADFRSLEKQYPGVRLEVTGEAMVESQLVQRVVRDLFHSLALAAVIIFLVITVAFRSIRLGLLSIIPNIFPLVATASLRAGLAGTSLDISSACSFAICLGIAVDDTIHFLIRYRHELQQVHHTADAIRRTFVTVGSALVMTTIVMIAGFGSVLTSQLPTHFLFASMACTTIGAALIGDLILLPALLVQFPGNRTEADDRQATG